MYTHKVLPRDAHRWRGVAVLGTLALCAFALALAAGSPAMATPGGERAAVAKDGPAGLVWEVVPPVTGEDLRDVFMLAEDDVWAVGNGGTVLHFDGATWSPVPISTTDTLRDIYMVSPTVGYIVPW